MTNTTLATIAATTRATRFWVGTNAAGDIAQFWTAEPDASAHPTLDISAHVVMPLGSNGAPAGFEPIAASADQAAGVVPAGWKLVPEVPPKEMNKAAVQYVNGADVYDKLNATVLDIEESMYHEIYRAMLAAAPQPPAVQQPAEQAAPVAESQATDERPMFEAWGASDDAPWFVCPCKEERHDGSYIRSADSAAWAAWQARAALSAPAAPVPAASEGWISVDERLPEDCQDVLVLCPDTGCEPSIWSAQWLSGSKTFESNSNGWADLDDISHWMPRPAAPATSDKAEGK
jgi:hypothetical protein